MHLLDPRQEPNAALLIQRIQRALTDASTYAIYDRMEWAHNTRDLIWEDKQPDARKRNNETANPPRPAYPWPGAPDSEVRLVDTTINELVDICANALNRADMRLTPRAIAEEGSESTKQAAMWGQVMAYYLDLMHAEIIGQGTRFADIAMQYGHSIMRIGWHETHKLEQRTMEAQAVAAIFIEQATAEATAMVAPESGGELSAEQQAMIVQETGVRLAALFQDPGERPKLVELVQAQDPQMPPDEARRVASMLQHGKPATYYAVVVDESRPCWRALLPWVSVWYDPSVTDIREAPWVCESHWMDEPTLRERAVTEGWNADWLEQVLLVPGRSLHQVSEVPAWVLGTLDVGMGVREEAADQATGGAQEQMFQIVEMHYRASSKAGFPCTYRTILHAAVTDSVGLHEVCTYAHGRMPYVSLKNERKETLVAQRGLAELGVGAQMEMKLQRDARGSQVQLRANPPMQEPVHQLGGDVVIQPGERLPLRKSGIQGEYRFLDIPAIQRESMEMEQATVDGWNEYVGRGAKVPPDVLMARRQAMVDRFLIPIREAMRQTFQLVQQYTDDVEASTIAGVEVRLQVTREQIQGQFDLSLKFDVADLDLEHTGKLLNFIGTLLVPLDANGVLDRTELIRYGLRKVSPELAARVVQDTETVSQQQIDAVQGDIAKMAAGVEPAFKLGTNHALAVQIMDEAVQKSPRLQALLEGDQEPGGFAALFENYRKQHLFQVEQARNAVIGRVGGEPVLG